MTPEHKQYRIHIRGIVQGVGFRPFVHNLARRFNIAGSVVNDTSGVRIVAEGQAADLVLFLSHLETEAPPLALIDEIHWDEHAPRGLQQFKILASTQVAGGITLISPDIATCDDCLRELFDTDNRRYRYPFINCTNCGPRYTIIGALPYDRQSTTMAGFTMCPACEHEYEDPADRRFHAQPNACWSCGPRCQLLDNQGQYLPSPDPIRQAAEFLNQGRILAVKGLGGFHLAVDGTNEAAVRELRRRKRRDEKPFALMIRDIDRIRRVAPVSPADDILLRSPHRPIVLLPKGDDHGIAPSVSPRNRYFGIMLPYTPLHALLFAEPGIEILVMTSGNFSEEPIVIDNRKAVEFLGTIADYFLVNNRDILIRNDDSVVRSFRDATVFLRRSRGYAPRPIRLDWDLRPSLAVGAELKNTVALGRDQYAFLSQHIGDLENYEVFSSFESSIDHLETLLDIKPQLLAYDLHPDYLSTQYALSRQADIELEGVQHHHAHIAACMAENGWRDPVIGLALDGTGYGTDGCIWGGEILIADLADFARPYHFEYQPMPGGARAIREPWRMAASYLYAAFGAEFKSLPLEMVRQSDPQSVSLLVQMIDRRLNCPDTSSLGRLFDGISALCGIRRQVLHEGQAAMELEMCLEETTQGGYEFPRDEGRILILPLIRSVVTDLLDQVDVSTISYRFHRGLVDLLVEICREIRQREGLDTVALSGGVFQNAWLSHQVVDDLLKDKFTVLFHRTVPCNDGGISLGQLAVANFRHTR